MCRPSRRHAVFVTNSVMFRGVVPFEGPVGSPSTQSLRCARISPHRGDHPGSQGDRDPPFRTAFCGCASIMTAMQSWKVERSGRTRLLFSRRPPARAGRLKCLGNVGGHRTGSSRGCRSTPEELARQSILTNAPQRRPGREASYPSASSHGPGSPCEPVPTGVVCLLKPVAAPDGITTSNASDALRRERGLAAIVIFSCS